MVRSFAMVLVLGLTGPVWAETKAQSCAFQADVVNAVRTARIERVKEKDVEAAVLATEPGWPEKYNKVIPLVTPWVYEMKRRAVKEQDLGAAWTEFCLKQ